MKTKKVIENKVRTGHNGGEMVVGGNAHFWFNFMGKKEGGRSEKSTLEEN